jgi:hypothetical protein
VGAPAVVVERVLGVATEEDHSEDPTNEGDESTQSGHERHKNGADAVVGSTDQAEEGRESGNASGDRDNCVWELVHE